MSDLFCPATLVVARHAKAAFVEDWFSDEGGSLTVEGRAQAHALADAMTGRRIAAIYASDVSRSVQTAEIVAAHLTVAVTACKSLREVFIGALIGTSFDTGHIDAVTGTADFLDAGPVTSWFGRVAYLGWYFWAMGLLLGHPPLFGSNFGMRATAWRRMRGTFHRGSRSVHDDLDLSFQVRPGMTVVFDPDLGMQISARPFDSVPSMLLRSWRGIATLAINWPGWMYRRAQFARRRHAAPGHSSLARGSRPSLP